MEIERTMVNSTLNAANVSELSGLDYYWMLGVQSTEPWLFSFAGTLLIHELCYFGFYIPYLIADFIPALHKYKLQKTKVNTLQQQIICVKRLLFNHFIVQTPLILLAHPILTFLGMAVEVPLPSWQTLAWTMLGCFIVEDFYFYWIHRLLHYGWFYKNIHKIHHDFTAPFGIAAEYAHPAETIFLGIGTVLGPFLFARHLFTLWLWLVVRLAQTIEVHSGYDFPWSLNRWVPFWGGAEYHDFHHETFMGPYSSTFTVWDHVFGTDSHYRARRLKLRESQKKD